MARRLSAGPVEAGYVEGERVFGPPPGSFDREWVAHDLERVVAGLDFARAYAVVGRAWQALRHGVAPEREALQDALARSDAVDTDLAGAVAERVLAFCDAYDVPL